jgi:surface polysaccharide O-acyltransferase-like enzyme
VIRIIQSHQVSSDVPGSQAPLRQSGIDAAKVFAAFCVLLIHFCPFPEPISSPVKIVIRFAVPFFFIVNGYFFGLGAESRGLDVQTRRSTIKLVQIYAVWWVIYLLFPSTAEIRNMGIVGSYFARITRVTASPEAFFFYGPTTHLWYFPALICAIWSHYFILVVVRSRKIQWLLASSVYICGVLGGSYSNSKFGIALPTNSRHLMFFSLLPFYVGFRFATYGKKAPCPNHHMRSGLILFIIGFLGHYLEAQYLLHNFGRNENSHDYLFATILMSCGVFLIAQREFRFPRHLPHTKLGKVSGGIYLVHILILQRIPYLEPFFPKLIWDFVAPFFAFLLSYGLCLVLLKTPWIKNYVPT